MHPSTERVTKRCSACRQEKSLADFHLRSASPDGRQHRCKQCASELNRKYNSANSEARRETWRNYRRDSYLQRTYGISDERYTEMLELQGGVCKICLLPGEAKGERRPLHVDHDHACCPSSRSCGSCVRGLLCQRCNKALGLLRDNTWSLQRAIDYLTSAPSAA